MIEYKADPDLLLAKIKKIVIALKEKHIKNGSRGKLIRVEVPFETRYLIVNHPKKGKRELAIKKVMGIEIVGKANKLKAITEGN